MLSNSDHSMKDFSFNLRFMSHACAAFILSMGLLGWNLAIGGVAVSEAGACDATTSSTVKVTGIRTTTTEAYLSWTEKHGNGDRYFCYGLMSQGTCPSKVPSRSSPRVVTMNNLKPQTKYFFKFHATYKGTAMKSITTGTFTTDGSSCGTTTGGPAEIKGVVLTAGGDSLEGVKVDISKTKGGTPIKSDTTGETGEYTVNVIDAGKYFISFTSPPFTAPAPESVTVAASGSAIVKTVKMTGAYQAGGTVMQKNATGVNAIVVGATVKIFLASDSTKASTYITNDEGHYNFGLLPGTYTLHANLNGKNYSTPKPIVILNTDVKISDISLGGTSALKFKDKFASRVITTKNGTSEVQINGARLNKNAKSAKVLKGYQTQKPQL